MALLEAETALHRHVADIGDGEWTYRRHAQDVLVGPDPFDAAHGAGAEPRAGTVGDAKVHGHADQRDVEAGKAGRQRIRHEGSGKQRCRIGEWPLAAIGRGENLRGDGGEGRVVDVTALGVGIFCSERPELVLVHTSSLRRSAISFQA